MLQHINLKSMYPEIVKNNYLTHSFDSYPAKMIPHMAKYLIEKTSTSGQTILDPFCGSGSVLVESIMSGRSAIGVDINPLATILARTKTTIYDTRELELQLDDLLSLFATCKIPYNYNFPNQDYWFTPATLRKIGSIRSVLDDYLPTLDSDYIYFWKAILAAIVRGCSKADTRGPKPFISKKARETRSGKHFNPYKFFELNARNWITKERNLNETFIENRKHFTVKTINSDSRTLSQIVKGEKIDGVVTSPPYLSAQDYYRASKLQLYILGHSSAKELIEWSRDIIGSDRIIYNKRVSTTKLPYNKAEQIRLKLVELSPQKASIFTKYILDMSITLHEISNILEQDSYCALVLGYNLVSGMVIPTPELIIEIASQNGFLLTEYYCDRIRDRWVPPIRNGHNGVINDEHLLIFRKQ